ncbi:hypothetical protein PR048_016646 [Dryococelus australis]|uniref:Uncharacterized protein n=1 Tax=Dryococelus australis TaxID=614101 RepID=A0ABQ9H7G6_9NEOP|nr:hypothetical protein PR048_016646 [Dryococelus australis]
MPLVGGFPRGSPVSPPLHSSAAPLSPRFTHIGSQDVIFKSHPNLATHTSPKRGRGMLNFNQEESWQWLRKSGTGSKSHDASHAGEIAGLLAGFMQAIRHAGNSYTVKKKKEKEVAFHSNVRTAVILGTQLVAHVPGSRPQFTSQRSSDHWESRVVLWHPILLASHQGEAGSFLGRVTPGFSHVGNRARRCRWSEGFSRGSPISSAPCISALLHTQLVSPPPPPPIGCPDVAVKSRSNLFTHSPARKVAREAHDLEKGAWPEWVGGEEGGGAYLSDGVLAGPVDDIVQRSLAAHVIDAHELQQAGVYEAHAHAIPHVHRRQVRHHGQRPAEATVVAISKRKMKLTCHMPTTTTNRRATTVAFLGVLSFPSHLHSAAISPSLRFTVISEQYHAVKGRA